MSVKEIRDYEYRCDICGARMRSDALPRNWYQLNITVQHNDLNCVFYDNTPITTDNIRTVSKVFHTCSTCSETVFTIKPTEMEMAVE